MSYEKLREECNRRLPERLELKPGCEFIEKNGNRVLIYTSKWMSDTKCLAAWIYDGGYGEVVKTEVGTILGTPLTIADVLRVLKTTDGNGRWAINEDGEVFNMADKMLMQRATFNLAAPLSDPSNAAACEAVLSIITDK